MAISPEKQQKLHAERRKQIVDTAYYLFFTKGYRSTSVNDIAAEAGISKGLIYRYYKSKEELLLSQREETFTCLNRFSSDSSPKHALEEFLKLCFSNPSSPDDYIGQIAVLFEAILDGDIDNEEYNTMTVHNFGIDFFTPIFRHGQDLGEIREGNAKRMADIYWHMIMGYCFNRDPQEKELIPEDMVDNIMRLFT